MIQNGHLEIEISGPVPAVVVLPGVLSINCSQGRRNETEPFRGGAIDFEYLQSVNGTPTPIPEIGVYVEVRYVDTLTTSIMHGIIVDIEYNYTLAGVNTYRVVASDLIGTAGQATLSNVTIAAGTAESQIDALCTAAGVSDFPLTPLYTDCSGYTYTGNLLDILNKIASTGQSIITCDQNYILFQGRRASALSGTTVFGRTSASGVYRFDAVNVASAIQNRFNYIVVSPDGLADVTSSYPVVGAKKSFEVSTLNVNTTDAGYLADYLWGKYSNTTQDLEAVSFTLEAQYSDTDRRGILLAGIGNFASVATTPTETIYGTIIGRSFSGSPSGTRGTYYFSGSGLNDYLELDNAVFGKLDTGRLAY